MASESIYNFIRDAWWGGVVRGERREKGRGKGRLRT